MHESCPPSVLYRFSQADIYVSIKYNDKLSVVSIHIPILCKRQEDIDLLVRRHPCRLFYCASSSVVWQ